MWFFAVLTQVQIFCTLIAAGFAALKQTALDLSTSFGAPERSQNFSRSERGYSLKTLASKRKKRLQEQSSFQPFASTTAPRSAFMLGTSVDSDDGSQRGIMR